MAYKVAIDASKGGSVSGNTANDIIEKDYTLKISEYINKRLKELGIESFLVRDSDTYLTDEQRVNIIKNTYGNGNNIIVISNRLNSGGLDGAEVMYALRNNSRLASLIANNIEIAGQNVLKYYQQRNDVNTALDDDYLIRNTANNQSIVIDYGYVDSSGNDVSLIKNNYNDLAEAVVKSIAQYAGITYYPVNNEEYYVVKSGDNLWAIASKYGLSVSKLKEINKLTSNTLSIGQLLKVSVSDNTTSTDNTYTVKSGDSLYSIASKYNTTVNVLRNLNNLSSDTLSIGQKLIIPSGTAAVNQLTYTVQKGDSLYSLANKYDTTVDKIKQTNNLTSNTLSIGQVLIIPSTTTYITHVVTSGDTLYSLASKYNSTVDIIKKLNNLSSNTLSIGQKILIPA